MCGFFAVFSLNKCVVPEERFASSAKQISSRGGDQQSYFFGLDQSFALFHTRLVVCGNELVGTQPQVTKSGRYGVLFNGEVYNYQQLAFEMGLEKTSDTEVLLVGVDLYGEAFLDRLLGIFAITLIDFTGNQLILRRDKFGIKPLYFYRNDAFMAVSSTPKAMFEFFDGICLDEGAFLTWVEFGTDFFGSGLVKNLVQSQPGKSERVDLVSGESLSRKSLPERVLKETLLNIGGGSKAQSLSHKPSFEAIVDLAFDRQVPEDQPLGIFLSGGVDSSFLAFEVAKRNPDIEAHTAAFIAGDGTLINFEDVVAAQKVSNYLGIKHVVTEVTASHVPSVLEDLIGHFASPFYDAAVVPLAILSEKIKQSDIKVVFSGDGADELFGGYPRHSLGPKLHSWKWLPFFLQLTNSLGLLPQKLRRGLSLSKNSGDQDKFLLRLVSPANDDIRQLYPALFGEHLFKSNLLEEQLNWTLDPSLDFQTKLFGLDLSHILPDLYLQKTDRATAYHGLECRVPFLDEALVDFSKQNRCFDVASIKRRRKQDFKKLAVAKLPDFIVNRSKKGFGVPFDLWMQNDLCKSHALSALDYIAQSKVIKKSARSLIETADPSTASLSWKIYMLSLFLKTAKIELGEELI